MLVLGLIYHLEDPIGALRIAREVTRGTALVEYQLTAHTGPIRVESGQTDVFQDADARWAAILEPASEQQDEGDSHSSFGGVVSRVPNRAALLQALEASGYREVRMLEAPPQLNAQYVRGDRGIAVGRA